MHREYSKKSPAERFARKIDRDSSPHGCHLWTAHRRNGYGRFAIDGRSYQAHRVAWELVYGPIPDGLWVLHNCPGGDNPSCVNVEHLFLGTAIDNARDMASKGRCALTRNPENHPSRVLTAKKVRRMRLLYATGLVKYDEVARMFMCNRQTAREAIIGRTWPDID